MLRHPIFYSFCNKSIIVIFVGMTLLGCAGTTVQRQHHLLQEDSSMVSVYFLRPGGAFLSEGIGTTIRIDLDGEELMKLAGGQYTFLRLRPGTFSMVVTSEKQEPKNDTRFVITANGLEKKDTSYFVTVELTRSFYMTLAPADSVYLIFKHEESGFLQRMSGELNQERSSVPLGERGTLVFPEQYRPYFGFGYTLVPITQDSAITVASALEPIEGAKNSPLHK